MTDKPDTPDIDSVITHPYRHLITKTLAQMPNVTNDHLSRLAANLNTSAFARTVRDKALSPNTPLAVDILRSLDTVRGTFTDDLSGAVRHPHLAPQEVRRAVSAISDAIVAAYAAPILTDGEFRALFDPWRLAISRDEPPAQNLCDANRAEDIEALINAAHTAATGCHDPLSAAMLNQLLAASYRVSERERIQACSVAYEGAVAVGRHRQWHALRHRVHWLLTEGCARCRTNYNKSDELHRAVRTAADAACVLLVADLTDPTAADTILEPVTWLIRNHRRQQLS